MHRHTSIVATLALAVLIPTTVSFAQYRVGPVYPEKPSPVATPNQAQSGYDPFQLNWRSGRFEYVPIPYDNPPAGSGYSPFRFNWHSGQWDYVPVAPIEPAYGRIASEPVASTAVDTRLNPQQQPQAGEPQQARIILPPEPAASPVPSRKPSTQPTTAPEKKEEIRPFPPGPPPKMERKLAGHWQYDYNTGKWVFVLPSD